MIGRRELLGIGSAVLTSCGGGEQYFGKATPPPRQTLVYEIGGEPSSLDPATCLGTTESYVMPAIFEGLVSQHPDTFDTEAGLATHYETNAKLTEFTFFLRGHPRPTGTELRGAGGAHKAALWSDGRPVTAEDFVFSWRRLADPGSASAWASYAYPVVNGKEINEGKSPPETLGVRAEDDFTLRVWLKAPAAHFLKLATSYILAAVPRHAVHGNASSWTKASSMPSCGPFLLHEWKPYDRIVLRKNTRYYDAGRVLLDEIVFLPITDGATSVNLYKAGNADAMYGRAVPPLWIPALRGRKDFHSITAYRSLFYAFNTTKPPLDNALVRYAFNMATDKHEIARFLAGGQRPAWTVVPPWGGYRGITKLPVEADGHVSDVLSYDPRSARALMKIAGAEHLVLDLTFPNRTRSKEIAQILQKQWGANLGCQVNLLMMDWNVWAQNLNSSSYQGVIESGGGPDYADPNGIFDFFTGRIDGSGWRDPEFDRLVENANAEGDPAVRMGKLAACEERLLRAMPVLPLFFDSYGCLQKPYVAGMTPNALDLPRFKYAWIDTNWRPQ
jgi:oligopeptide transport system substrate-binding protein